MYECMYEFIITKQNLTIVLDTAFLNKYLQENYTTDSGGSLVMV